MIVVVFGPGGVGKGTVVGHLLDIRPEIRLSRSWTTRGRRPGETEDAYVFVDEAAFEERIRAGGFLEWTRFDGNGHLYGTPVPDGPLAGGTMLLEIDLDGAQQVKQVHPEALLVLITAPSREAQEARLRGRGDDDASVSRRLAVGDRELDLGRRIADHVVVNDDAIRAAEQVADIIDRHRMAPPERPVAR